MVAGAAADGEVDRGAGGLLQLFAELGQRHFADGATAVYRHDHVAGF